MKRWLILLMCLGLMVPALAEEDEGYSLEDLGIFLEEAGSDPFGWNFPLSISEIDPDLIILANKDMLLPSDYEPKNKTKMRLRTRESSTMYLEAECASALKELFEAAEADGYKLYLKSAYRSYKTQRTMYNNRLAKNNGKDDGWVAKPGASDHQTGLGADVVPYSWTKKGMNEKMAQEKECQWMAEHCWEYGFVLRYPEDKQEITQINYEPWHLRYVGKTVADYMWHQGICLEEFRAELDAAIEEFLAQGGEKQEVRHLIQVSAEGEN